MHVAVIGSGMAGLSCTRALVDRGVRVTVIDSGERLDTVRNDAVQRMKWSPKSEWDRDDARLVSENDTVNTRQFPLKLAYGSDYIYAMNRAFAPTDPPVFPVFHSFALGGFSNVWGGSVLPYNDRDLDDWPIGFSDLEPYYRKVLSSLPLSAEDDVLSGPFPLLKSNLELLESRSQERSLLCDIRKAEKRLLAKGIYAGASRLTVYSGKNNDTPGCDYCGLCLTGCPREAIYRTSEDVLALAAAGKIDYLDNLVVKKVSETGKKVTVSCLERSSMEPVEKKFDRVFVGAGTVNTARIMMESMGLFDTPVVLHESAKFIIPWIRFAGERDIYDGNRKELAQAFIALNNHETHNHWVHMQVSPANIMVRKKLRLETAGAFLKWLSLPFIGRLMLCYGSLNSRHSPAIEMTLRHRQENGHHVLSMKSHDNHIRYRVARNVGRVLLRNSLLFRAVPLGLATIATAPGNSYHTGGGFPMSANPGAETDTDILGRPQGFNKVHLVDSTTFPSVPGTTIGLSIMANAYRIGSLADLT